MKKILQAFENLHRYLRVKLQGNKTLSPPCENCRRGLKRKIECLHIHTKRNIENDYIFGEDLGKGNYGTIRSCKNKISGDVFACKRIAKGKNIELVHRELETMTLLSGHPNIVSLTDIYEDKDCFQIVMELCAGGDLWENMVKRHMSYTEQEAAYILKQIMLPIKHCHAMGVVHRDIKPENVLLTSFGCMKLADFGFATTIIKDGTISGGPGTPYYVAPEVVSREPYTEKVDVWSAGVLLHVLLRGTFPFVGNTPGEILYQVKKLKLDFNSGAWRNISESARDLIGKMMDRDVSSRISAEQVLTHPWILMHTGRDKSEFMNVLKIALSRVKLLKRKLLAGKMQLKFQLQACHVKQPETV